MIRNEYRPAWPGEEEIQAARASALDFSDAFQLVDEVIHTVAHKAYERGNEMQIGPTG